jgi:predicted anti-sigma-YlaC factor YlaD
LNVKAHPPRLRILYRALGLAAVATTLAGCSVKQFAIKEIASSLAEGSGSAFAQEADIELAGEAIPFSLKLVESLLAAQPDNADLLMAASSGFTQYANGWVEQPADFIEDEDFFAAQAQYERAVDFYLRAYHYGLQGLESRHAGFPGQFRDDPIAAAARLEEADAELAYWTAAGLGSAISLSRTNPELLAQLPAVEALAERALKLDPDWNLGAIHELLITLKSAGTGDPGLIRTEVMGHYKEAVRISGGASASAHVSLAEAISIQDQDRAQFERLLRLALAVDPDRFPDNRLAILIAQRRAEWLLDRVDDLFLE